MYRLLFSIDVYIFAILLLTTLCVIVIEFVEKRVLKHLLLATILTIFFVILIIPLASLIRLSYLKPLFIDAVSDSSDGAILALRQNGKIYLKRVGSDGKTIWTKQITNNSSHISSFKMSPNNFGGAFLFWGESKSEASNQYLLYAQSIDTNGNCLWGENNISISSQSFYNVPYDILNKKDGGALFSWIKIKNGYEIRIQRVDALGNVLWGENGKQIAFSKYVIGNLSLVSSLNRVFVVWTVEQENHSYIYVQILDLNGNSILQNGGLRLDTNSSYCRNIYALSDNSYGLIILFQDGYGDPAPIYAVRLDYQGKQLTEKVEIASSDPSYIRVVPQKDGFILGWTVSPGTIPLFPIEWSLHIQKFSYLLTPLWNEKIVYASKDPEGRIDFNLGAHNNDLFIVWQNVASQSKGGALFAQKLNAEGKELWENKGVLVSPYNLLFYPSPPQLVPDDKGGMIVISLMKNFFGTKYTIFLKKFSPSGDPLWEANLTKIP